MQIERIEDRAHIRLRQSKTGARVVIPVAAPLKVALDAAPRRSPIILTNKQGRPWTESGFRATWAMGAKAADIVNLTYNDLRGTAVTRLALVGCTEPVAIAREGVVERQPLTFRKFYVQIGAEVVRGGSGGEHRVRLG